MKSRYELLLRRSTVMKKILVINGPNLNLLGAREPGIYGKTTLKGIENSMKALAKKLKLELDFLQSSHEGEIVEKIGQSSKKYKAVIMNPAAYTHTSVAIRDAVAACGLPVVEVHISNIYAREEFRQKSLIAPVAKGQISGFGADSYLLALRAVINLI
jgi:3-dehydroquinate dehydratase II